ncbi:TPA: hypothetical protein DCL94_03390 [candidate division WWE3 bacterium]|nr:hypothetical protein [candidate division WWE3 bacterium]
MKILMLIFVLFVLINGTGATSVYSGRCVYPGGIFKLNLSGDDNYRAAVSNEHSILEFYDVVEESAEKLEPGFAGRFQLSKLNYVKVNSVSGPYFKLGFDIYDGTGNLVSTIDSGGICNLAWFREKHGGFGRHLREKPPPEIYGTVVSAKSGEKGKNMKAAVFCLVCFTLGGFMGFRTPKMIEY